MSHEEQINIEEHVLRITSKQAVGYVRTLVVACFLIAGSYFGTGYKLDKLSDQINALILEKDGLKKDIKDEKQLSETRYIELKLALETKLDKK